MDSNLLNPATKVGSTKRELSADLHESPTTKRAKRARPNKKDEKATVKVENDANRYVEQMDWVDFSGYLPPTSPAHRKRSSSRPPLTPRLKHEQPTSEKGNFSKLLNSFPLKEEASKQGILSKAPHSSPATPAAQSAEKSKDENKPKTSTGDGGRSAEKERKREIKALKKALKKESQADAKIGTKNDGPKNELPTKHKPGFEEDAIMKDANPPGVNTKTQASPKIAVNLPKTQAGPKTAINLPKATISPRIAANTRKTRADRDPLNGMPMFSTAVKDKAPAVAGPSAPKPTPARQPRELTPMSDDAPRKETTFKEFPNPQPIEFSPLAKVNAAKEAEKDSKGKEVEKAKKMNGDEKAKEAAKTKTAEKMKDTKSPNASKTKGPKESKTNKSPKEPKRTPTRGETPSTIDTPIPSPLPASLLRAPAGTKTLKAINKHLKAISAALADTPTTKITTGTAPLNTTTNGNDNEALRSDLSHLRTDIARLHDRLARDTLRAAARHEMLFNALVKVSRDVLALAGAVQDSTAAVHNHNQEDSTDAEVTNHGNGAVLGTPRGSTASAVKDKEVRERLSRSMLQSRKTLEQCLRIYSGDMDRAGSVEEVARYAGLVVQYAGDLFKTLG
ncbi:hypothetical protein C8A05DRAFT_35753 [Staphylotrichum tortipilum]|uniref:Uncharacterized protein n=1 Tax=Staphylotrichum tortipilum TaxID=2831512 RepID=A0AAN6MIM4_9PEZI|nr:hypothetical protein C8A05DRAFT_35753 [Staphylotrichum longicolle]